MAVGMVAVAGCGVIPGSGASARIHGNPDPGGQRLAALQAVARRTVPATAQGVHATVHGFRWDPQTCDGAAPGWSNADVDLTFHAPSTTPFDVDALMQRLGWKKNTSDEPSSDTAPAEGPSGPGFRSYEPSGADTYGEIAQLTPPDTYGDGVWDLDINASPAEVPSHDC
ncbi:hypothetical protein [Allobranchiibius huperziae]|uniref:hypothetical protein n=1 Tax=Allobranchiibius huperziae TaxID=1874116 RepID=UPI0015CCC029|nr:hypothetical protein [Allobranchiibius huperziae]